MKKIIAIITVFSLVFAFAACGKKEETPAATQPSRNLMQQEIVVYETVTDNSGELVTDNSGEMVTVTEIHSEIITEPVTVSANPADWSAEEIVAFYKSAAIKSYDKTTSQQVMSMQKMVVNEGDGALGFFIDLAEPLIKSVLEKNSTEFTGITGGFNNLVVSDAQSVKAYKDGDYTVIEMTMKQQTDGTYGDMYGGTVGHAISVLGNVSVAAAQFPKMKIDFENADIVINYTNPTVKVKINKDGMIEKGSWRYTVDVDIANLKIDNIMVKTAQAVIDYDISVGGGF